ncbi:hypothetical protein EMCRGX_G008334 [Ephydatia muelleri]
MGKVWKFFSEDGKVVEGMDVVREMEAVGSEDGDTSKPVVIKDCGMANHTHLLLPATPIYSSSATPNYSSPATPNYSSPATPIYSHATPIYSSPATPIYSADYNGRTSDICPGKQARILQIQCQSDAKLALPPSGSGKRSMSENIRRCHGYAVTLTPVKNAVVPRV